MLSQSSTRQNFVVLSLVVFAVGVVVGVGGRELAYRRQERNAVDPEQRKAAEQAAQSLSAQSSGSAATVALCLAGVDALEKKKLAAARVFFIAAARRGRDWRLPYVALADLKRRLLDDIAARELLDLAPPDLLGGGNPLSRLWKENPRAAVHAEAVYQATLAKEWNTVDEQARETLKLRPNMDGVLVRRFRALRQLNRMEEAKELLVELRRRVPLYLLWNDITDFVHTRYAPEPTDRIHVTTWQIPDVYDLQALPDNRVCAAAGARGVWFLKPDGGSSLLPGTAESDGNPMHPHSALPTPSGEIWLVGSDAVSDELAVSVWKDGKVAEETPVPPALSSDFEQLFLHQSEVWAICEGIVCRQQGNDYIAYVPARGREKLALPPGIWRSAHRKWNQPWQADANEEREFKNEAAENKFSLTRYWQQVAPDSGLSPHDESEEENLQLWHDATGQLWYGVQQFDGKVFLPPNPKIRASFRKAWWLSGPRWWNPPEFWRREWVYLATHFRGPEDEGPLLRSSDRDTTGRLWVGLWNAGLMAFDGHRWLAIPLKDVPATVRKVTTTRDGAVWAACEDRVVRVVATVAEQR